MAIALTLILYPVGARAEGWCGADTIRVTSLADSIFVTHLHAFKQGCLQLAVTAIAGAQVVSFYERDDSGRPCLPLCCFDHVYGAAGLSTGRYTVRVYDETGSILYGEQDVDVAGPGGLFGPFLITQGDPMCVEPATETTWGSMRLIYR